MFKTFTVAVFAGSAQAALFEEDKDHRYIKDYPSSKFQTDRHFFDREMFEKEMRGDYMDDYLKQKASKKNGVVDSMAIPAQNDFISAHDGHRYGWSGDHYQGFGRMLGYGHETGYMHGFVDHPDSSYNTHLAYQPGHGLDHGYVGAYRHHSAAVAHSVSHGYGHGYAHEAAGFNYGHGEGHGEHEYDRQLIKWDGEDDRYAHDAAYDHTHGVDPEHRHGYVHEPSYEHGVEVGTGLTASHMHDTTGYAHDRGIGTEFAHMPEGHHYASHEGGEHVAAHGFSYQAGYEHGYDSESPYVHGGAYEHSAVQDHGSRDYAHETGIHRNVHFSRDHGYVPYDFQSSHDEFLH